MPDPRPIGSVIPIQPWLTEGLRQLGQSDLKSARRRWEVATYLVQQFPSWRVYPARVGRWYRWDFADDSDAFNDPVGAAWWLMRAVVDGGHWKTLPEVVQLLDPATSQPIAEHVVMWQSPILGAKGVPGPRTPVVAMLDDPRVCGLFAVFGDRDPPAVAWGRNRHTKSGGIWNPEEIEEQAAKLVGRRYKDFRDKDDGPWIVDRPQPSPGGKTRWSRYVPPS